MNENQNSKNPITPLSKFGAYFSRQNFFVGWFVLIFLCGGLFWSIFNYNPPIRQDSSGANNSVGQQNQDDQTTAESNAEFSSSAEALQEELGEVTPETATTSKSKSSTAKQPTSESNQTTEQEPVTSTSSTPQSSEPEAPSATVAFYADSQTDENPVGEIENHRRVVNYILATGANPIFHAGDLMEDGTQQSLDYFNDATSVLRSSRTFYAALGNNDREVGNSSLPSSLFLNNFSFPNNEKWYSVNIGNLHMVILDSAFSLASTAQRDWLIGDLQSAASQSRITGVMFHHPTFTSSIQQYLIDYGVDFVVAGHNHLYNHSVVENIHYLVTSGQPSIGYFIANVYENRVLLTVFNHINNVVEVITINER